VHAGFDSLIYIIIFLAFGAISNWLKRKQQGGGDGSPETEEIPPVVRRRQTSPTPPPPPPSNPENWEEELRRLLGGEPVIAPPPPLLPPPPVPPARPARPFAPAPVMAEEMEPIQTATLRRAEERVQHALDERPFQPLPVLAEATPAFVQASQLDERMSQQLREVTRHAVGTTCVLRKATTPTAAEALALVRNPRAIRSALVASIILGPPKSLAEI